MASARGCYDATRLWPFLRLILVRSRFPGLALTHFLVPLYRRFRVPNRMDPRLRTPPWLKARWTVTLASQGPSSRRSGVAPDPRVCPSSRFRQSEAYRVEALLEVRGVGKRFGAYQALVDVN